MEKTKYGVLAEREGDKLVFRLVDLDNSSIKMHPNRYFSFKSAMSDLKRAEK